MDNAKYRIFKRDDFMKFLGDIAAPSGNETKIRLTNLLGLDELAEHYEARDSVVIRLQDVFAPPALDAYANSITVALQFIDPETVEYKHLQSVADYFHEAARQSWEIDRKVPD